MTLHRRARAHAPADAKVGPQTRGRDNVVGARTSERKLNGVVYTPLELARAIVDRLELAEGMTVLDPSCGEGVFLVAVLERAKALGISLVVEGWDIDADALEKAALAMKEAARRIGLGRTRPWKLVHRDALAPEPRRFDVIVGNPPYLEAKRMPDDVKARVRELCPIAAVGAFDLYAAFVERCAKLLAPRGVLSFIVPNRLAVTSNAADLRPWLMTQGEVTVIDLSRDQAFPNAAVYPMIVELRRGVDGRVVNARLHDRPAARTSSDALAVDFVNGRLGGRWPLASDAGALGHLQATFEGSTKTLGDLFDFRWTVSFHRAGLREQYVSASKPRSRHARRFVGGAAFAGNREVEDGKIHWAGSWIDYDEARARADGNPLPPLSLFTQPKVAICQNALRCRAAFDDEGFVFKDTFIVAVARPGVDVAWLRWLPDFLHGDDFHRAYETLYGGTRKRGGYLQFLGSYLAPFPAPALGIAAVASESRAVSRRSARTTPGLDPRRPPRRSQG
jgi:SAM-dependent methyltransferase